MTGAAIKFARLNASWTQRQAASRLGLTQAYLSMVERGRRPVSSGLAVEARRLFHLPPTVLPLELPGTRVWKEDEFKSELGALGYPGFGYLRREPRCNPAQLLFQAINRPDLDARVVEALPWLASTFVDMDWDWLTRNAKLNDRQNRLGFVVSLAGELAQKASKTAHAQKLANCRRLLERSQLVREDTLCHESMTQAERRWLKKNRPSLARHWHLLTDLEVRHLAYVPS
jgi:transcriptional regulator with XRE-family HTH domain